LGAFEIVLGTVVLAWRDDSGPVFYAVVTIWAFMAALVLLRQALRQRSLANAKAS
jgi:multidrug transporter EmrE-like cation transporter